MSRRSSQEIVAAEEKDRRIRLADLPHDYDYGGGKKKSKTRRTIKISDEEECEGAKKKRRDSTDHGDAETGGIHVAWLSCRLNPTTIVE